MGTFGRVKMTTEPAESCRAEDVQDDELGVASTTADIEVDELLVRHTSLDVEIEKFLEVETWNDQYGIPQDLLEQVEAEKARERSQDSLTRITPRDPLEVERELKTRDLRFKTMHSRVNEMCKVMDSVVLQNTTALKKVITDHDILEHQNSMAEDDFSATLSIESQRRSSLRSKLQQENDTLRACLQSGSFKSFSVPVSTLE